MDPAAAGPLLCLACLLLVMALCLRDIPRFGTSFVGTACALWASAYLITGVKMLIAPLRDPALVGFMGSAVYLLVIVITAGHPAMLLAPHDRDARNKLSKREFVVFHYMGWLLAVLVVVGVFSYGFLTEGV